MRKARAKTDAGKITKSAAIHDPVILRKFFDNSIDAMFVADPDTGILLDCNAAACVLVEKERDMIIGQHQSTLHPSKDLVNGKSPSFQKHSRSSSGLDWEERVVTKGGAVKNVIIRAARIEHDGRHYLVGVFRDITVTKRTEEELRESEEKYRAIFFGMTDGILIADVETGRFQIANPAACRLLGYSEDEFRQLGVADIHPSDSTQRALEEFVAQVRGEKNISLDMPCLRKDGQVISADIRATPISLGGRPSALGIFSDVTERKKMEERLRQADKMQAIGQLAGGIAHDFNNRLVSIQGFAQLLTEEVEDKQHRDYAERIVRGAKRAGHLTQQMLTFARKGDYLSVPVNINSIVAEVVMFLEHSIDKSIKIRQHLDASSPVTMGDPTQLQNTLLNLAINARDAMPDGGELIFATTVVTPGIDSHPELPPELTQAHYLSVSVSDTGIGMDEETIEHAFEPFFTTKGAGKGTGMGLASVYGATQNHEGCIMVKSEPGKGSTFTVYLPLTNSEDILVKAAPAAVIKAVAKRLCVKVAVYQN